MPVSFSQTFDFSLNIVQVIEQAYLMAGEDVRSGYDLNQARISLDLVLTQWINKGINLWTLEERTLTVVDGTSTYILEPSTVDILSATLNRNEASFPMERIGIYEFNQRGDVLPDGRPFNYLVDRGASIVRLILVPTPDNSTDVVKYWRVRYMQDSFGYINNPEVPRRFIPALIAGLAYNLALKKPLPQSVEAAQVEFQLRGNLRDNYMELFEEARSEDRERSSTFLVPYIERIY